MSFYFEETEYGFDWGPAKITRIFSDDRKGWVTLGLSTPKYSDHGIQIYVTKTGKVRIHDPRGEWIPPSKKKK